MLILKSSFLHLKRPVTVKRRTQASKKKTKKRRKKKKRRREALTAGVINHCQTLKREDEVKEVEEVGGGDGGV